MRLENGVWLDDGLAKGVLVRHLDPKGIERHVRPQTLLVWVDDVHAIREGQRRLQGQFRELALRGEELQRRSDEERRRQMPAQDE